MGGRSYRCPICRKTSLAGMRDHMKDSHGLSNVPQDHMMTYFTDREGVYKEAREALIKVEEVRKMTSLSFDIKGAEWGTYVRYPHGNWHTIMGGSEEDTIDSETEEFLEKKYQEWILDHPEDKLEE